MKHFDKNYSKAVISVFTCLAFVICFSFGVSAAEYEEIDISNHVTGKEYTDGDEVIVTYNLPLNPYTDVYGYPPSASDAEFISSSINVHFEQTPSGSVTIFKPLYSLNSQGSWNSSWQKYVTMEYFDELPFEPTQVTHILVDGVSYEVTLESDSQYYYFRNDSGIGVSMKYYPEVFVRASSVNQDIRFSLGYNSTEITPAEYDTIYFNTLLMGDNYENVNLIDVSDIKSGSNFTLSFDYTCVVELDGDIGFDGATFTAHYLDKNYKEVSTTTGELDLQYIYDLNGLPYFTHTIDFMVPEGAEYFWLEFDSGDMAVSSLQKMSWSFQNMTMSCSLSAIEENTRTLFRVEEKLDSLLAGEPEDQEKADEFNGAIDNVKPGLDQNLDELNKVEKPNIADVKTDPGEFVDQAGIDGATMLLGTLTAFPLCTTQMVCVVGIMLIAYILHGKKGG